jgi:hypothetical protein
VHSDFGTLADQFIAGTVIDILESSPAADAIDQDAIKIGALGLNISDRFLETIAPTCA